MRGEKMNDTTLSCPNCHAVINVNESLAAPLVESLRKQYECKLSQYTADVARRDALIREQQTVIAEAQTSLDERIAEKIEIERDRIATAEAKKARLLWAIAPEVKNKTGSAAWRGGTVVAVEGEWGERAGGGLAGPPKRRGGYAVWPRGRARTECRREPWGRRRGRLRYRERRAENAGCAGRGR